MGIGQADEATVIHVRPERRMEVANRQNRPEGHGIVRREDQKPGNRPDCHARESATWDRKWDREGGEREERARLVSGQGVRVGKRAGSQSVKKSNRQALAPTEPKLAAH